MQTLTVKRFTNFHKLRNIITNKYPGQVTDGIILLHDNSRTHVAQGVQDQLNFMRLEMLRHSANL